MQNRAGRASGHNTGLTRARPTPPGASGHDIGLTRAWPTPCGASGHDTGLTRARPTPRGASDHNTGLTRARPTPRGVSEHKDHSLEKFHISQSHRKSQVCPTMLRHWLGAAEIDRSLSLKLQWMPEMLHLIALLPVESQAFEKKN